MTITRHQCPLKSPSQNDSDKSTYCKRILGYNNTRIAKHNILSRDILAHRSSHEIEPDTVLYSQVQRRKFRLPCINGERLQDVSRSLMLRDSVCGNGCVNLCLDFGVPDRIISKVADDPRGLNGSVYQAGE